jgi:two-component system, cell cycle response regulator
MRAATLAELQRSSPAPALARIPGPLKANYASLDEIFAIGASGADYGKSADRLAGVAGKDMGAIAAALAEASDEYDRRASASLFKSRTGSKLIILLLALAFAFFYRRAARLAAANHAEARTDSLTGLPNRRALVESLEAELPRAGGDREVALALFDLDGFKQYNDTFGHPAGDALLHRLGDKLSIAAEAHGGYAARLGGDEFCLVADGLPPEKLQAVLHEALSDEGAGFSISAVSGLAHVPAEVADPNAALGLADTRLYAAKAAFHAANRHLPGRALPPTDGPSSAHLAMARLPDMGDIDLGNDIDHTAKLAAICAETLGLPADQIGIIEWAAQLHDIGKAALPVAILAKRDALTEDERQFIRRHTAIGERLLNNANDLEPVAAIVRASQERWDGDGYPDRLAGEQIPIGSRIIAVTAAFVAMITDRPHAAARSVDDTLTELDRCSGTQFDPTVVSAFAKSVSRLVGQR